MRNVRPVLVIMDAGGQWPITPTACPSSGTMSFSKARRQASGDPGKQNTSRPWYTPAIAPDIIAELPISGYDRERKSSPNPGSRSEEHTSELQSRQYLVCRLLLEKKKLKRAE